MAQDNRGSEAVRRPPAWRGVAYDTGTNFTTGQGALSRVHWDTDLLESELGLVGDQLNANCVTLYGSDIDRLSAAASAALELDLHVILQPRLVDRPAQEVLDHLGETALLAERLRADGGEVTLTVGAVHLLFLPGLVPGEFYHERMANLYADHKHHLLTPTAKADPAAAAPALNEFLGKAAAVARGGFRGRLGYSAAHFEEVDWQLFDYIGLMHQYQPTALDRAGHLAEVDRYRHWGKPIVIAEFGTATYREAEQKAFFFWDIADRSGPTPTIIDGYTRDESAQAAYHLKMLDTFAEAGVHGVTVSELLHPTHPHSTEQLYDLDTASMCLVKSIRDDFADPASSYRWEPKESFHAIADQYAHWGFQEVTSSG